MEAKANRQYGTVMTLQLFVANLNANDPLYLESTIYLSSYVSWRM